MPPLCEQRRRTLKRKAKSGDGRRKFKRCDSSEPESSEPESSESESETSSSEDEGGVSTDTDTGSSVCSAETMARTEPGGSCGEAGAPEFEDTKAGHMVCVPVQDGDAGKISASFALVIREPSGLPSGLSPGAGLLLEPTAGGPDERRNGFLVTNTHVSLETATALDRRAAALLWRMIVGLNWETMVDGSSSLTVLRLSPHWAEYLEAVREHGIAEAVPAVCRAQLDGPLHRGPPKTPEQVEELRRMVAEYTVEQAPYACKAICVACGSAKPCSYSLGPYPLGADCAEVIRRVAPACRLVDELQGMTQIPYPHEFQRMLEDAGVLVR